MAVDLSYLVRQFEPLPDAHPDKHGKIHAINPRFYYGKYPEHKEADEFVQSLPHGTGNHTVVRALLLYKELKRAMDAGEIAIDDQGHLKLPGQSVGDQLSLDNGNDISSLIAEEVARQLAKAK